MGVSKNPKGVKPDKLMRDAIHLALKREAEDGNGQRTKKLQLVADRLVEEAIKGNIHAIKEINERMDGKVPQGLANEGESPFMLSVIQRVITDPKDPDA